MSRSTTALFVGLILGLTAAFGTFETFVVVVLFGGIGLVMDGKINIQSLLGRVAEKR